jgi:4-amino-4-deoxychorismate lyase
MYPLIETIKIVDGIPQNLKWHQLRFTSSISQYYGKRSTYKLEDLLLVPEEYSVGIVKARFSYNAAEYLWKFEPYVLQEINSLKIIYDDNIDYKLKYSDRSDLKNLYQKKGECDDILIVKKGMITDTSYCNIVFFDGTNWITSRFPLLKGTCRERLLHQKKIQEEIIKPDQLDSFKSFKLINAMRDLNDIKALPVSQIFP